MLDQNYDKELQFARSQFASAVATLRNDLRLIATAFGEAFASLSRIQFEAPWTRAARVRPNRRHA
ncbi:MAG TPA: hypothetical protein VHM21_07715 [Sphingomicrobium sp.]|jgi:hypothetical protein|nr:hypothetical protein [Sphingomicrobium sp.]